MSEADLELLGGLTITNGLTVTGGTIDFSGASSGGGIGLTDISATNAPLGTSSLSYNNTTGVFTYTPPDLSSYATTSSLSSYATTASLSNYALTSSLAAVATSGAYADITGTPSLATVATSGAYADLTGTPTVPTTTDNLTEGSSNLYFTNARASSAITGSDLDMGGNKVLFANMYSAEGNLPSATTYHGMFAHVHGTGKGYFAHNGNWIKLIDETSSTTDNLTEGSTNLYYTDARARAAVSATTGAAGTAALSYNSSTGQFTLTPPDLTGYLTGITGESLSDLSDVASTTPTDGQVLTYDTTNGWQPETPASGGIALTDLSAGTVTALGGGSLSYNNTTGQFLLTPPDLSGYATTASLAAVATSGAYSDLTGAPAALTDTDGLTEGSTNLYHTTARARSSISANTSVSASGSGNLSYNQVNGQLTFYPPDLSTYLTDITGESLSDLSDVSSTTPTDGQVLTYDTTNGWQPETPSSGGGGSISWIASANTSSAGTPGNGGIALGGNTSVGGDAVAVGNYAVASASESVAVGSSQSSTAHLKTNVTGSYGVGIGSRAQVHGNGGISMGWQAEAGTSTKAWSIAIGNQALSQYEKSVAIGYSAATTADNQLMLGGTTTNGFTSVQVGNTSYTPTVANDLTTKNYVDTAISSAGGLPGAAESTDTTASTATGTSAVAVGYDNDASGNYSTALGFQATASSTSAIAIGYSATAQTGNQTIAIGQSSTASGTYGISLGLLSSATYNYSAAIGYYAQAGQANQLMLGRNSTTNGFTSIRVGNTSYSPTDNMDLATKKYVDDNSGGLSYVVGSGTAYASGSNAVALGNGANSTGANSVSLGANANATASGGIAIGFDATTTSGNYSGIAIGYYSDVSNSGTAVGGGYNASTRCYAGNTGSAFGYVANASAAYSVSLGAYSDATNTGANAFGYNTQATGQYSTAVGNSANATQTYATAVGYGANATSGNATALGYGSSASTNQFVLGNTGITDLRCQDTSISSVSDSRDKTQIEALSIGLDFVNAIEPKAFYKNNRGLYYTAQYEPHELVDDDSLVQSYTFDQEGYEAATQKFDKREFGFIAQDVAAQLPTEYSDARVSFNEDDAVHGFNVQRFTMGDMTPILWKALRELSDKHDQLQADYDALLARVVALENA